MSSKKEIIEIEFDSEDLEEILHARLVELIKLGLAEYKKGKR